MGQELWIGLLGGIVGTILALTGAGGGALGVPLLMFAAGLPLQQAAPVSLVAVGLAATLGAGLGLHEGIVRYRAASVIGAAGMLTAPLGVALAHRWPQPPMLVALAALMLVTAWRMLAPPPTLAPGRKAICHRAEGNRRLSWNPACASVLALTGSVSGMFSGLFGVGGGFVIVPSLEHATNLDLRSIQATTLAVMALVAASGVTAAIWHGQVSAVVALPFAAGAVAGLLGGRRLGRRLPARRLRQVFAAVAVVVAGLVLMRAARG